MGFGKRWTEPIKVVSTMCEKALDKTRTPMIDYMDSYEEKLVVEHEGQHVAWFTIQPLDPGIAGSVKTRLIPERYLHAFIHGCTACSDRTILAPDDWEGTGLDRAIKGSVIKGLPDQLWDELGRIILKLGELTVGEQRRFAAPVGSPLTQAMPSSTTAASADSEAIPPGGNG